MSSHNGFRNIASFPSQQAVAKRWISLLHQTYPDWDDPQIEAIAQAAVCDFCGFLRGQTATWDLQSMSRVLPETLAWSSLTRLFITLRESVRENAIHCDTQAVTHIMERLDDWIEITVGRYEVLRAHHNREQLAQIVERVAQLNTLSHCVTILNASLDLVSALNAGAQLAQTLTGADLCVVYQREGELLRLRSYAGHLPRPREVIEIGIPRLLGTVVVDLSRQDIPLEDVQQYLDLPQVQASSCFPLCVGNVVLGKLTFAFTHPKNFTLQELRLQEIFANHLGQAIYNAQFHEQLSELTTANERRRIACEMHDTMLQTLVSMNINLRVMQGYAHQELWDDLALLLDETRQLGKIAIQEGRETLDNLRDESPCSDKEDLINVLQPQLAAFAKQSGITPQLKLIGEPPFVTMNLGHQLRRLVGEALTNIYRHASAHSVQIMIEMIAPDLRIQVRDDGVGFQPERVNQQTSFGLSAMQERSRLIDAQLAIDSVPGKGTTVTIRCPLTKEVQTS